MPSATDTKLDALFQRVEELLEAARQLEQNARDLIKDIDTDRLRESRRERRKKPRT